MGDIEPGWYDDTEDTTLARWWDGRGWTEHTLVIADQPTGVEPPPPAAPATRFPVPPPAHEWLDDPAYEDEAEGVEDFDDLFDLPDPPVRDTAALGAEDLGPSVWPPIRDIDDDLWHRLDEGDDAVVRHRQPRRRDPSQERQRRIAVGTATFSDRVQELPTWLRIAVPVGAVVLAVGAVAGAGVLGSDDGTDGAVATEDTQPDPERLRAAADLALQESDVSWFTRQGFLASIPPTCTAASDDDPQRVADRIVLLGYDDFTVGRLVDGLEVGSEAYCPDAVRNNPTFFDDVFRLTGADAAATTSSSSTTAPTVTTTSATTATTKPSPTTTRRSSPPATSPTTQPPATTTPPTTAAPTTTAPPTTTTTTSPTSDGPTTGG